MVVIPSKHRNLSMTVIQNEVKDLRFQNKDPSSQAPLDDRDKWLLWMTAEKLCPRMATISTRIKL